MAMLKAYLQDNCKKFFHKYTGKLKTSANTTGLRVFALWIENQPTKINIFECLRG